MNSDNFSFLKHFVSRAKQTGQGFTNHMKRYTRNDMDYFEGYDTGNRMQDYRYRYAPVNSRMNHRRLQMISKDDEME